MGGSIGHSNLVRQGEKGGKIGEAEPRIVGRIRPEDSCLRILLQSALFLIVFPVAIAVFGFLRADLSDTLF
jgi:hypothetical protein